MTSTVGVEGPADKEPLDPEAGTVTVLTCDELPDEDPGTVTVLICEELSDEDAGTVTVRGWGEGPPAPEPDVDTDPEGGPE
jgi:hypothetical protein